MHRAISRIENTKQLSLLSEGKLEAMEIGLNLNLGIYNNISDNGTDN